MRGEGLWSRAGGMVILSYMGEGATGPVGGSKYSAASMHTM